MSANTSENNPFIKMGDTYVNKNNIGRYDVKNGCVNILYLMTRSTKSPWAYPSTAITEKDTSKFCASSEVLQKFLKSLNPKHGE